MVKVYLVLKVAPGLIQPDQICFMSGNLNFD